MYYRLPINAAEVDYIAVQMEDKIRLKLSLHQTVD